MITDLFCSLKKNIKRLFRHLRFLDDWVKNFQWYFYIGWCKARNSITGDIIFARCWVDGWGSSISVRNWGDDINKFFFEYITGAKVIFLPKDKILFKLMQRYIMIGSILGHYELRNAIVYGTGFMSAQRKAHGIPKKIISVRGPLTRNALLQQNIDCPEHYGDPVLLLPLFYKSSAKKYGGVSIIPNIRTFRGAYPVVDELVNKYNCQIINMTSYGKWTDIIDEITGSSFIISESLHGLIVAEAYNIPCVWVEFIDHLALQVNEDWNFKFLDFYESIGKHNMKSIKLYEDFNFDELMKKKDEWKPGTIDYEQLLNDFPFKIDAAKKFPLKP